MTDDITSLIGKKFRRTGKDVFVTVVDADEKTKTVIIEFSTGKTMSLTTSTLNDSRLWEIYEGEIPEPPEPEAETYIPGTPQEEATILKNTDKWRKPRKPKDITTGRPEVPPKKERVSNHSPKKPDMCPAEFVKTLKAIAKQFKCELKHNPNVPNNYAFMYKETCVICVYKGKGGVKLSFRAGAQPLIPYESYIINNHMLAGTIRFSYLDDYNAIISTCVEKSIKYVVEDFLPNKTRKKTRKNKKEEN